MWYLGNVLAHPLNNSCTDCNSRDTCTPFRNNNFLSYQFRIPKNLMKSIKTFYSNPPHSSLLYRRRIKHFFSIGFALLFIQNFVCMKCVPKQLLGMINYLKTRRLTFSQAKILNPIKSYCSHSTHQYSLPSEITNYTKFQRLFFHSLSSLVFEYLA